MVGYDCISVNASHTISIGALIVVLIGIENCKRSRSGIVERGKFRDTRWGNSRPLVEARKRAIKQQLILIYPKQLRFKPSRGTRVREMSPSSYQYANDEGFVDG